MLICVDGPKLIRVYRPNDAGRGGKRTRLGMISKRDYEFKAEGNEALTPDESVEVEEIINSYKDAELAQIRAHGMLFPQVARQVVEYYATQASDVQKRMIAVAVQEMARAIKISDRGA